MTCESPRRDTQCVEPRAFRLRGLSLVGDYAVPSSPRDLWPPRVGRSPRALVQNCAIADPHYRDDEAPDAQRLYSKATGCLPLASSLAMTQLRGVAAAVALLALLTVCLTGDRFTEVSPTLPASSATSAARSATASPPTVDVGVSHQQNRMIDELLPPDESLVCTSGCPFGGGGADGT